MSIIIHRTNGLIDIQSFTLMGMSAKPNSSSPIGRFGTGLKYAIAVLVRQGARPVLWIGQDRYEFFASAGNFRGTSFQRIRVKRQKFSLVKATHHDLPFTTDYGRDWVMWMAFRELEANTRDEDGGQTHCIADDEDVMEYVDKWHTCLVIQNDDYSAAYDDRDSTFLPQAMSVNLDGQALQVLPGPSNHLYYRGMRAKDLPKPSLATYNVLAPVALTEDRQIGSEYEVRQHIADYLTKSKDKAFIAKVLTAKDDTWEHGLDFQTYRNTPTEEFLIIAGSNKGKSWPSVGRYYQHHNPAPVRVVASVKNQIDLHKGPWEVDSDGDVSDADGTWLFKKPSGYEGDWDSFINAVIKRCGKGEVVAAPIAFPAAPPAHVVTQPRVSFDLDEEYPF